ncbi:MAG TPA: PA0069 family radical SAM protein [Verrucomicrobiae bacterium]|nr:PA0069 family radical SAM protein [Verrucomicrobiae bacterium]
MDKFGKKPVKGRGALSNPAGRFESVARGAIDDGWNSLEEEAPRLKTQVTADPARSIISTNDSPDVSFRQSINPYRGCENGCIYCFARPSHAFLNLSPGLDFETKLFYKANAAELFEKELRKPGYVCRPIVIGVNTDAYQPIEREYRVTRSLLEVAWRFRQPMELITKGATLMERDVDLIGEMGRAGLADVTVSITSLSDDIKRSLEPRTSSPAARLRLVRKLTDAGVPVTVNVAPVIPAITDHEIEAILEAARDAGAVGAGWVMLRLPWEVKDLFREWLDAHYPDRADHVMSLMRQIHGGEAQHRPRETVTDPEGYNLDAPAAPQPRKPDRYAKNVYYNAEFGARQRGNGPFAALIEQRFRLACRRLGLDRPTRELDTKQFLVPPAPGDQFGLEF